MCEMIAAQSGKRGVYTAVRVFVKAPFLGRIERCVVHAYGSKAVATAVVPTRLVLTGRGVREEEQEWELLSPINITGQCNTAGVLAFIVYP